MTWLLTPEDFASATDGVRRGEITPALFAFLHRLTRAVTLSGLLPPALSPTGHWDEDAADDTLQSWLYEKLLRGGLTRSFQRCASARALARYLERALKHWLISNSRSKGTPRLVARARALLTDDSAFANFVGAKTPSAEWWGLAAWQAPESFQGSDSELISAAYSVGDVEPLRYGAHSSIADPVVSKKDLTRLINGILQEVAALLTLRHFDVAFRGRFAPWFDEPEEPLGAAEDVEKSEAIDSVLAAETAATRALSDLTRRQVLILRDRFVGGMTLEELADRYSVSRGTVDNELRRAFAAIRPHLLDEPTVEQVVEKLMELAFEESDGDRR